MNSQAALQWQIDMGVDEAIAAEPINRLRQPKTAEVIPHHEISNIATAPQGSIAASPKPQPVTNMQPALPSARKEGLSQAKELAASAETLEELYSAIQSFDGCPLKPTAKNTVIGDGAIESDILVIGEAPGADEDRQGIPFCGRSGQLLDKMLGSIGLSRQENCYITNMIFWRPPGNRKPSTEEILLCEPFVLRHIELFNPKIIIAAGGTPASHLTGDSRGISRLRGRYHEIAVGPAEKKYRLLPIYHPSYLLRQPAHKRLAWQDLLMLQETLKNESLLNS